MSESEKECKWSAPATSLNMRTKHKDGVIDAMGPGNRDGFFQDLENR